MKRGLDLTDKIVVTTGASRGAGKQAAFDFAQRSARTVETDCALSGTMGETLREMERRGRQVIAVATDLAQEEDLERLVDPSMAVPITALARMQVYFAACENSWEYTGRLFWAKREMAAMHIESDPWARACGLGAMRSPLVKITTRATWH
jgi:NAD(P)-dependent dehydrogenase (short-subunit alcohol dehydrogenase family)